MQTVERLAYFKFYVADYLLDTTKLTLSQHGAYLLLLFRYYWQGSLKFADRYQDCHSDEERKDVDFVTERFFHVEGEWLRHNRIERELASVAKFIGHQSVAGKASAAARAATKPAKPMQLNGVELPAWLNAETWYAWIKVRPARARTTAAQTAALAKLEKFKAAGLDPNSIVAESLANGWQGIFPPDYKGRSRPTLAEQNRAAGDEARRRMEEEISSGKR